MANWDKKWMTLDVMSFLTGCAHQTQSGLWIHSPQVVLEAHVTVTLVGPWPTTAEIMDNRKTNQIPASTLRCFSIWWWVEVRFGAGGKAAEPKWPESMPDGCEWAQNWKSVMTRGVIKKSENSSRLVSCLVERMSDYPFPFFDEGCLLSVGQDDSDHSVSQGTNAKRF